MDADWSKVAIEWAPADASVYGYKDPFGNQQLMWIVGSRAVQLYYTQLRTAGAQVRKVLIANAAQKWGVDAATLKTEPSVVINPANGQRLTYGEIAAFGTIPATLPAVDAEGAQGAQGLPADRQVACRAATRRSKVNGTAQYAIDVKLPGMVYASTLHSPVHNAQPQIWEPRQAGPIRRHAGKLERRRDQGDERRDRDRQAAERARGRRRPFRDRQGRPRRAQGDVAEGQGRRLQLRAARSRTTSSIHADPNAQAAKLEEKGDVKAAFAGAAKTYKAEFRSDYGYHAQMEPLNAVVRINDAGDKVEVWEGSQAPDEFAQGGGQGARPQGGAGGLPPVLHGRRLRPALARRLRGRMRADRQGGRAVRSS